MHMKHIPCSDCNAGYMQPHDENCPVLQLPLTHARRQGDPVNHPSHYGGDTVYEVIKVCEAWGLDKDTYLFQVVRYTARAGKKDPSKLIEDLEKARFYLDRKIENLKKEQEGVDTFDF